jgi:endonuclease/exonuclease/phosphatase (EEP) superfamily protein YafD
VRVSGLRDSRETVQLLYYTTPWLVQFAGFAALALWDQAGRRSRWQTVGAVCATLSLMGWLVGSWRGSPPVSGARDLRVVHWNVARPAMRFPQIGEYLREIVADVIALAEWQPRKGGDLQKWRAAFPGYQLDVIPGNMLLLARGEIVVGNRGMLHAGSYYGLATVKLGGRECVILQADVYGGPLASREEPLRQLTSLAVEHAGQPLILLGDLNTPRESWHLTGLRKHYRHAFEAAGRGYAETWPMPLPVLGLDQVWVGAPLEVLSCQHGVSPFSDHRPVIVDLRWRGRK